MPFFNVNDKKRRKKIIKITIVILAILCVGVTSFFINAEKKAKNQVINKIDSFSLSKKEIKDKKNSFLNPVPIGQKFKEPPQISNLAVTDLDDDHLLDIIVCDTKNNTVSWIRQYPADIYTESVLAIDLPAPAHVEVYDYDNDGDKDLMVAVLGMLYPTNEKIGSVIILENDGHARFKKHTIAEKIARVADVRAGDLDGDGDIDLAVAQFGYNDGETRWIENLGKWKCESHNLQNLSGPINVIISDIDKDGDLDLVSLVSQEWEEIYCFINDGKGHFTSKLLWGSNNEDFGSSGISLSDIDKDGDEDILYTNGDSFNYNPVAERPWHGAQWLENKGGLNFEFHRLCNFVGAYNCRASDIDRDGDIDLVVISCFNVWEKADAKSFIWLENTGNMHFEKNVIPNKLTHLITLEFGDFNNDGLEDMVTGGMQLYPPYDPLGRITLWINNGGLSSKK